MHRIFAGLSIPDPIADQLLLTKMPIAGAKWRQREHFHITLSFFGSVSHEQAEAIADALEGLGDGALSLSIKGVGWFGRREPRAIWAALDDNSALDKLAGKCRKISAKLGLKRDEHPFRPHVTLAYCNGTPLEAVRSWSERFQILQTDPFIIDRMELFESFTNPSRQSQYVAQAEYRL